MKRRKDLAQFIFCLALGYCGSSFGQSPSPAASPSPNYEPIKMQAGNWNAAVTFFDDKGKPKEHKQTCS